MFKNTEQKSIFLKRYIKHGMPADPADFSDLMS